MIILLPIAFILAVLAYFLWRELKERQKENIRLSQKIERQNRLLLDLDDLCEKLTRERNEALDGYRELIASYTVTDSDMIKYSTDELMEAAIEKHLLKTITYDALKDMDFEPEVGVNVEGKKVYSYRFHFKQV